MTADRIASRKTRSAPTVLFALALAGCHRAAPVAEAIADSPGGRLERAALERGLVSDPARASPTGLYAQDTDRLCIAGAAPIRVGALVDYGDGQGCSARGTATRNGDGLRIDFGGGCRLTARFDGDRVVFPPEAPDACAAACSGRASLAALDMARLGASESEALALSDARGRRLCAS